MEPSAETPQTNRAEQPARFTSVHDCEAWLATLSPQEASAQPPLQRLSTTLKCLQASPSRQKRADIQRMAKDWGVVQKTRAHNTGIKHKSHEVEKSWKPKSSTKQHGYTRYSFEDPVEHLHLHGLLCAKLSQIHSVPADSANRSKWQVLYSLAYNATCEHAVPVCCASACLRALHTCTAALALYIGVARKNICLIHGPVRLCATVH